MLCTLRGAALTAARVARRPPPLLLFPAVRTMAAYSDAAGYKEMVVKASCVARRSLGNERGLRRQTTSRRSLTPPTTRSLQKTFPSVLPANAPPPAVSCLRYHHLGLAVRSVDASAAYYAKLGFARLPGGGAGEAGEAAPARGGGIVRLRNASGLELHLVQADADGADSPAEPTNVLMDCAPEAKAPGHTHASWTVPSVPGVKAFLASQGIELSGTRSTLAVFVRDPDRTTLEFERNDGGDDAPAEFAAHMIGNARPLDHVGVRVRPPYPRHAEHYARCLGFNRMVATYEPSADAAANLRPWVTRTEAGVDVNFILNATTAPPAGGEAAENALLAGGVVRPGILYAAFAVAEADAADAAARLRAAGGDAALDVDVAAGAAWGGFPADVVRAGTRTREGIEGIVAAAAAAHAVPPHPFSNPTPARRQVRLFDGAPTVLFRDLCGSVVRLVPTPAGAA